MSWVCPYQSHLQPGKGSLSVPITNSFFFQEWWFGAMGSCLLLPKNDDLCEQQLLIHGQGRAVRKSGYVSTALEGFSLYAMVYFIKMQFRWCLKQPFLHLGWDLWCQWGTMTVTWCSEGWSRKQMMARLVGQVPRNGWQGWCAMEKE